jgi:hypothetical protein
MANDITIVVRAVDKASSELKKLKTSTEGLKNMASGLGIAMGAAAVAAGALKTAYDNLITPAMEYGLQVKDLSTRIGVSVQEASKMIQVFDDLRINMTSAQTAFRFMVKEGIQPSIDSLASLSDQYNNIQDPIKKAEFAMKNFGARGGLEMTKLLVAGGDAIRDMAAEAEKLGLVLGEDAVQAAQDFYAATDKMDDSMKGLTISLGVALLPAASTTVDWLTRMTTGFVNATKEADTLFMIMVKLGVFMRDTAAARDELADGFPPFADVLRDTETAVDGLDTALGELSNAQILMQAAQAVLGGDMTLANNLMTAYNEADALDKKLERISELLKSGLSAEQVQTGMATTDAWQARMAAGTEGGLRGQPGVAVAPVASPVLAPLDTTKWQEALRTIENKQFPTLKTSLEGAVTAPVATALRYLNEMDGRTIVTKQDIFQTTYKKTVNLGVAGGAFGQHGLDFVVPPGYPDDSYPVHVSSGERVVVSPVASNDNSRSINIANLTVSSDADRVKFDRQMRDWLGA